jgi:L-ascorbate metabolism protein UlaG (beta-lactamase superfamily)
MTVARRRVLAAVCCGCAFAASPSCTRLDANAVAPNRPYFEPLAHDTPRNDDARLSVLWVGHATVLLQMDDRWVLTDPLLETSVGQLQRRVSPPGVDVARLPMLDAVVVSHVHPDHLSLGSLERIERKIRQLYLPEGGMVYLTDFPFEARELRTWHSFERAGLRVTGVPVQHTAGRYGIDGAWMTKTFTGYVIEYAGLCVFFAGDTAYDAGDFERIHARFPHIDLALLPIAPIRPRDHMHYVHMDPEEALDALRDLGADFMVPIHFDTLVAGTDTPGEAREALVAQARERNVADRVAVLRIGERRVILPKP